MNKKTRSYVEFLYILPLLILVALISYYPLYGWIYAFHDYMPPKPISAETFVGLKWFKYIVENPTRLADVGRVLVNTFAMSGISLAFTAGCHACRYALGIHNCPAADEDGHRQPSIGYYCEYGALFHQYRDHGRGFPSEHEQNGDGFHKAEAAAQGDGTFGDV